MRAQMINDERSWNDYRSIRNRYNRKLKAAKNDEMRNVILYCHNDSKKLWKELKRIYNNNSNLPDFIKFGDRMLSDPQEIAENFNEYFVNSISEINRSIPLVPYAPDVTEVCDITWTEFEPTRLNEVMDLLHAKRKKSGVNNVNSDMATIAMKVCGNQIVEMINESLSTGIFPQKMKLTYVTPIPKVAKTDNSTEFRPINNSHPLDKVIQGIVKDQLEQHIHRNQILSEFQFAFRGLHSCETSLNLIILRWKEARRDRKKLIAVFLDFKRAFETVDREILVLILEKCGLQGTVLKWFKSWLNNREQCTKYRDHFSSESHRGPHCPVYYSSYTLMICPILYETRLSTSSPMTHLCGSKPRTKEQQSDYLMRTSKGYHSGSKA